MNTRLSLQELIKLGVEGFRLLQDSGQIGPPELCLASMEVLNDSVLVASIVPSVSDSMGIKIEACTVMSFMSSFFEGDFALPSTIKNLGVRAFTSDRDELMYVLSSRQVARYCAGGRPIEWLTNSIFQDNTPEHRRARAKLLVSRIEIGLRNAISIRLELRYGKNWWSAVVPRKVQDAVANASRGALSGGSSGSQLLEYTFLPHLKDIVLREWNTFKDILTDPSRFEQAMNDLNAIRRNEAHNRPLLDSHIKQLEGLYSYLAGAATAVDAEAVPGYLVENWRQRLATIVRETYESMPDMLESDRGGSEIVRRKFDDYAEALEEGLRRIKTVVVPPGKEALHSELEGHWSSLCSAVGSMEEAADSSDRTRLAAAAAQHEEMFGRLKTFTARYLLSELGH